MHSCISGAFAHTHTRYRNMAEVLWWHHIAGHYSLCFFIFSFSVSYVASAEPDWEHRRSVARYGAERHRQVADKVILVFRTWRRRAGTRVQYLHQRIWEWGPAAYSTVHAQVSRQMYWPLAYGKWQTESFLSASVCRSWCCRYIIQQYLVFVL